MAEFQRVTTEVKSRFEGGLRQLEEETTVSEAPMAPTGNAPAVAGPVTPASEPASAEVTPPEAKSADA